MLAAAGSALQVLMYLGLPPDPDTAAHLAPFVWPPILAVAAVMLLLAVTAATFVAGRVASFIKADRAP